MECDICSRDCTAPNDMLCAGCARSNTYLIRLETAQVLIEKEQYGKQIEAVVDPRSDGTSSDKSNSDAQMKWREDFAVAATTARKSRVAEINSQIENLKTEIEEMKEEISRRKLDTMRRKSVLKNINSAIPSRQNNNIKAFEDTRNTGSTSFSSVNDRTMRTRAFLCKEVATLLRLKAQRKSRDGIVRDQYSITGMSLPNLQDINNIKCADLTAILTSTAHLLTLMAFYLGVRLPAEITIPHRDYPLPTINTSTNSYSGQRVAFPGASSGNAGSGNPFSSKQDNRSSHRPRPLFIHPDDKDEKLAQFAKRDPFAFAFFIEGISLLAWNVAWLNRSQGFSHGTTAWEDICNMGRNLLQLTQTSSQSPALLRVLSSQATPERRNSRNNSPLSSSPVPDSNTVSLGKVGQASHQSAHSFLGQPIYNEQMRSWKYAKWNAISDSLKKHLLAEMNNAEWELLQEQEWDDGGELFDDTALVKNRNVEGRDPSDTVSNTTTATTLPEETSILPHGSADVDPGVPKSRGTSGWTKLKNRDRDEV